MLNLAARTKIIAVLRATFPGVENLLLRIDIRDAYEAGRPLEEVGVMYPDHAEQIAGLQDLFDIYVHITQEGYR